MKKEFIASLIVKSIGFELTKSQEYTVDLLSGFLVNKSSHAMFLLKGYAGTGKTTLIAACVRSLLQVGAKVVLLAPTGRAAKVLSQYSGYPAFTIHKWIYRQKSLADSEARFVLNRNSGSNTVFIVDEASMLSNKASDDSAFGSGNLLEDLLLFVEEGDNCRLIICGDDAQLPPVKMDISPALSKSTLSSFGFDVTESFLSEVVRQATHSGILSNATVLRQMILKNFVQTPKFQLLGFDDIVKLSGNELVETLEESYSKVGMDETLVVSYSNKRANKYNQGIRNQILWREEELSNGDLLMVVRNNYFWVESVPEIDFIANGDIVEVIRIKGYKSLHGFRFAQVTVRLIDYQQQELDVNILVDTLSIEGPSLPYEKVNALYESVSLDYAEIPDKRSRAKRIKKDPFFNALQVKFAYAVTCHKAQGGQWKNVFIDQGFFRDDMMNREYLRWLYTALTRATEKVYLVNFSKDFFYDE